MDSHKVSVLPEHLKVVELGRRRRWSEDEKLRIVMESLVEPGNVSATARQHGISRSLLTVWRRAHKVERVVPEPVPAFVPAVLVPEPAAKSEPAPRRRRPRQGVAPSGRDLASQPTISRLKNRADVRALLRMGRAMVDLSCASFRTVPRQIVLDIDDTFDAVHGGQQLRLFNAHHDQYGFQPLVVFDGEGRFVSAVLRPACRAAIWMRLARRSG